MIFPEGTNTNGQKLVTFRTGAFSTGHPVQPVCIKRRGAVDTITWTWVQEYHVLTLVMLTLMTPVTLLELEFLPVVVPSEEEKGDPRLFANRVRQIFSEQLSLPVCDVSFKDAKLAQEELQGEQPKSKALKEIMDDKSSNINASSTSIDFVGNLTFGI